MEFEVKGKEEQKEKQEAGDIGNLGIGEDKPQIEPKKVVIVSYEIREVKFKEKISNKLALMVEHPDVKDKPIEISGVKYLFKDKLKESGLWANLDNDNKIPFNSAIAHLLRKQGKGKISELVGDQVDTVLDSGGYLVLKAY